MRPSMRRHRMAPVSNRATRDRLSPATALLRDPLEPPRRPAQMAGTVTAPVEGVMAMDGTMTGRDRERPAAIAPAGYPRWLVGAGVVALCVAALTAIVAFLVGDFDETEARIFATSLALVVYSLTGLAAAGRLRARRGDRPCRAAAAVARR